MAGCLAGLAGYVDAVGFLKLDGFFVSFMSGNSTRLGIGIVNDAAAAALAAMLVALFVLGVVAGSLVSAVVSRPRRLAAMLVLVAGLLAVAALVDVRIGRHPAALILAIAMGAENAIGERHGEPGLALTYVTGTLVKLGERIAAAVTGGDRWAWLPPLGLWSALTGGAVAGAAMNAHAPAIALWIAAASAIVLALADEVARRFAKGSID